MAEKRTTVFISSSLRDLREHRSAVMSVLEQGFGMEFIRNDMMEASQYDPITASYRLIDECDIFIGIYAYRYGFIPEGQQVSFIELEYDHASSQGKPVFCFIVDAKYQWPADFMEGDPALSKQFDRFKSRILRERMVGFFTTPDDLAKRVLVAVEQYLKDSRSEEPEPKEPTPAPDSAPYQVTTGMLNIRQGPGPSYPVVGRINKDETVEVIGATEDGTWVQLKSNDGRIGWSTREYLTPATPASMGFVEKDKNPKSDSDRPSGEDRLDYEKYARSFARIVLNHETSTPLTIGIYGQWGQGKSFLMGKIEEALKSSKKKRTSLLARIWKKPDAQTAESSPDLYKDFSEAVTRWSRSFAELLGDPKQWFNDRKQARLEKIDFNIVKFNAWAYVGTDHLWAGLVTHLYKEAEKYFGLQLHIARLWGAVKKSLPKSLLIFGFYALLGLGVSLLANYNDIQKGWDALRIAVNAFWGSVIGGTALASLPVLFTTLKDFIDNLFLTRSKNLQNLAARPDFRAQIGVMADIKSEISFIGKLLRKGKRGHPTRFVLFIDDLDRCEHTKAVEVLQAIMLLLADEDGAPFVIFMGIDARVIVRAIEATYGEVLVKAGINGYEYLDKIVQIPFTIPDVTVDHITTYVNSMIQSDEERKMIEDRRRKPPTVSPPPGDETQPPAGDEPKKEPPESGPKPPPVPPSTPLEEVPVSFTEAEQKAIHGFVKYLIHNPRKIKRIINIYRYARLLLSSSKDRKLAIQWLTLTEQWPLHVAWILEYIENDSQRQKYKVADKNLSDVFNLVKKDIHSKEMEPLLTVDADPDNFAAFIKENDFTVSDIQDILLPITFNINPAIRSEVGKQMLKKTETKPQPKPKPLPKKPAAQKKSAVPRKTTGKKRSA